VPKLATISALGILAAFLLRLALATLNVEHMTIYFLTFTRMDTLLFGALAAIVIRSSINRAVCLSVARTGMMISGLVLATVVIANGGSFWIESKLVNTVGLSALGVLFSSLIVQTALSPSTNPLARFFSSQWLRTLGRHSYAMYLFHVMVIFQLARTALAPNRWATLWGSQLHGQIFFYFLAITLTLAVARLSWQLIEAPFLRLKRFFPMSAGRRECAATSPLYHDARP
jgi:peptidoglycan/LPS O-acetylase OafA/YrhL